ncbi:hypothetical protein [Thalassotalea piscium]|uniref:Uncharacterized protein n=1 Tax=Thalassotalea piscium TaxID=1230533 RepID=A0A7X0NDZ3_9GAMM|nr:hypothetical protein [Thalassotalea piscium]MBB6541690.1 hypothetical protein [Thalassotalea piscium]
MKLISSCLFFTYFVLATFTGSQGASYGQQFQQLDSSINVCTSNDSESIDNEESEKKYLSSQSITHKTKQASFEPFTFFISHLEIALSHYSIRAPPKTLYS